MKETLFLRQFLTISKFMKSLPICGKVVAWVKIICTSKQAFILILEGKVVLDGVNI